MRFTKDPIYPDEQLVPILDDGRILTVKGVVDYLNWYRNDMRKFSVENESLKIENRKLMAYNSACEDTLLNVDVVLHRLIDKYCNNNDDRDVSICEVLHEFKKEIFPSTIQPGFKPIFSTSTVKVTLSFKNCETFVLLIVIFKSTTGFTV